MYKKVLVGLLVFGVLTALLAACSIRDETASTGPAVHMGGANFIVYSFWLPEQYGTECRASAFAFTTNFGRFVAAGFTFLVGAGVHYFQTLGTPIALTAFAFVVGLLLLPLGQETKGQPLPA